MSDVCSHGEAPQLNIIPGASVPRSLLCRVMYVLYMYKYCTCKIHAYMNSQLLLHNRDMNSPKLHP